MAKKFRLGYTAGVFDLFHVGHLNILKRAKEQCESLIVAVSTDELVFEYKNYSPKIPYPQRKSIIEAIRYVDKVVPQINRDKIEAFKEYRFDAMFVGQDWKGSEIFNKVDLYMRQHNGRVVYLPYTDNISSSIIKTYLSK
jgi:glycerol-3-phosphate cytidylyltransferase